MSATEVPKILVEGAQTLINPPSHCALILLQLRYKSNFSVALLLPDVHIPGLISGYYRTNRVMHNKMLAGHARQRSEVSCNFPRIQPWRDDKELKSCQVIRAEGAGSAEGLGTAGLRLCICGVHNPVLGTWSEFAAGIRRCRHNTVSGSQDLDKYIAVLLLGSSTKESLTKGEGHSCLTCKIRGSRVL